MFSKVRLICGKIPDCQEPENVCCLIFHSMAEETEAQIAQVQRQTRYRANEKRKELGVSEPLGAQREGAERHLNVWSTPSQWEWRALAQHTVMSHRSALASFLSRAELAGERV